MDTMEDLEFTFTARVQELNRVTIPRVISEELEIGRGSVVEVRVKRIRAGDSMGSASRQNTNLKNIPGRVLEERAP